MNENSFVRDADRVYFELRRKIVMLVLEPGALLEEGRVVKEMGISRTPVREAVIRLVSEGLVRREGRQVRISTFEAKDLRGFFEGIEIMSRAIHRFAAVRRSAIQLDLIKENLINFENEVKKADDLRITEANYVFHKSIAHAADSVFIEKAYEGVMLESLRLARQCFATDGDHDESQRKHFELTVIDHRQLYRSIEMRDAEEADRIASRHTALFRQRLSEQIFGTQIQTSSIPLEKN